VLGLKLRGVHGWGDRALESRTLLMGRSAGSQVSGSSSGRELDDEVQEELEGGEMIWGMLSKGPSTI